MLDLATSQSASAIELLDALAHSSSCSVPEKVVNDHEATATQLAAAVGASNL